MLSWIFGSSGSNTTKTVENVNVPFFAEIKDGVPRSGEVELEGMVLEGKDKAITFEFRNYDGIPIHINIRMGHQKEHVTVINSYDRGRWRREHRHKNVVSPNTPINMSVHNQGNIWKITINGNTYTFSHRLKVRDIRRLEIRGDIQINRLTFKNMDKHIEFYDNAPQNTITAPAPQSGSYPPNPAFTPAPYVPSSSPSPPPIVEAGTGPTIQPGQYYQPYPSEPGYNQGYPSAPGQNAPSYSPYPSAPGQNAPSQPYPSAPTQNSMYPNLN